MEGDSLLVRENAHIEKLLMLDVTNEAMEADSVLVKATDNYICNFPILKLPFFTESEIDSILLGKADTGHIHDTSDVTNLSLYLGQKLNVSDTSDLARKVHVHDTSDVTGLHDMLAGKSDVGHDHDTSDVNSLSLYLGQKLNVSDTSDLARKIHDHTISDVTGLQDALDLKLDISELDNFYTKTQLQTSGQSSIHANNITNVPWLTSLPSHDHDTRYYTKTNLQTSGQSSVHWGNVTNKPSTFPHAKHASSHLPEGSDAVFPSAESWGYLKYSPSDNIMEWRKPSWGDLENVPSVFPPASHNHDTRYPLKGLGNIRASGGFATSLETGRDVFDNGIYAYTWRTDAENRPADATYGCAIKWSGGGASLGAAQLLVGWTSTAENYIAFRSLRDAHNDWYPLKRIYHEGYKPQWSDIGNKPSVFPPESHNHNASNINSGTLSNSRLSFNPDYLVQGETIRRSCNYGASNPLDSNNVSAFYTLSADDPSNPPFAAYGIHINSANANGYGLDIIGRGNQNKILWSGIDGGTRQPWREIWHAGNLDTANIVNRTDEQYINGTKRFSHKLYANGGVYTGEVGVSDNYWQMGSGLSLYYAGTQIMACYPTTNDRLRWYAPFEHRDTVICDYSSSSGENVVAHYIKNNSVSNSTSASINFGFSTSAGYHHAAIKGMRTNKGASNASSIYLQARPAVSGIGTGHLEDVVEAGFDDQQAFVKYHNNPSIIHGPDSLIFVNTSLTFNPHRGSYAAYSSNPPQTMTLGSGEHGQTTEFCIVNGTFPLTIVYEGGYVVTEYGKIYKFKYLEGLGWFKYE